MVTQDQVIAARRYADECRRDGAYQLGRKYAEFAESLDKQWKEQEAERVRALRAALNDRAKDSERARILSRDNLSETSSDAMVKAWAKRRAGEAQLLVRAAGSEWEGLAAVRPWASSWHVGESRIVQPDIVEDDPDSIVRYLMRMCCSTWWTRAARIMLGRGIEADMIDGGRVHRRAGKYISDRNCERGRQQQARNAQMLLDTEAENELGERVSLADIAKGSLSNPWVRFCEMMVRIKGLEAQAERGGYVGLFVTWTLPSRFHPRMSETGELNPHFDGSRPRAGQEALTHLWARGRALVAKETRWFGLRVAEPHHDGTPHWHLMIWVEPKAEARVLDILRGLALEDSPDEGGAQKHRFKVERIEKAKGGAASYLAKYISKATAGIGLQSAVERGADGERYDMGSPSQAARRARWWASLWGIRQFQFFGVPPVGIYRECRRIREPIDESTLPRAGSGQLELFEWARVTADASDYGGHVEALGGVAIKRADVRLVLVKEAAEGPNRYGERKPPQVRGVSLASSLLLSIVTRLHRWVLVPAREMSGAITKVAESAPWTRGNNCNVPYTGEPITGPAPALYTGGALAPAFPTSGGREPDRPVM